MTEKPIIIYHANCMDGFTAMWCANLYFNGNIEVVPARNGHDDRPESVAGRDVYIVDYSFPRDWLIEMNEQANSLVVLDHHKSAEADLEGLDFCQFDMNRSGAGMAWDFFFPDQPRPWVVDYVEDQDIWKWELDDAEDICAFLNSQEKTLENWDRFHNESSLYLQKARQFGRIINETVQHYCNQTEKLGMLGEIGGHIVPIVNAPFFATSKLLNQMCTKRLKDGTWPKFAVGWHVNTYGQVKYSLRSWENPDTGEAFDVSELAGEFGGGGHHKASAFRVKGLDKLVHTTLKPLKYEE